MTRKSNDGFTLVELIVVIAILAILAGVGSAGYAGYIKAANKGNDKVLVGEIMRAIELGTYSTMFTNNDSFKMGSISYPVGFIALDTNGAEVVVSNTTKTEAAGGCEFETAQVTRLTSESVSHTCWFETKTENVYTISSETIKYCKTHGSAPSTTSSATEYVTSFTGCDHGWSHDWQITKTSLPAGTFIADNSVMIQSTNNSSLCEYAYANQHGGFSGTSSAAPVTTGALYDSLVAAFGDVSTLKLSYDGWSNDGSVNYATFYTSAPQLMEDMEDLSGMLVLGSKLAKDTLGISKTFENKEDVLESVAGAILDKHQTEDSWMASWNAAANEEFTNPSGFGLGGRENYSAARMAYNNAFASYMVANGIEEKYANAVKSFYTQSINLEWLGVGVVGNPGVVNTDAFTNSDVLKESFVNAGDTNAGEEGSVFNQCAALYETYKNSSACAENGKLVYDTMSTFKDTADIATDSKNAYGGDMFDYYNSYVNEISALYNAAQQAAGDGIIIIVSVEDGLVKCDVSPAEANPRND